VVGICLGQGRVVPHLRSVLALLSIAATNSYSLAECPPHGDSVALTSCFVESFRQQHEDADTRRIVENDPYTFLLSCDEHMRVHHANTYRAQNPRLYRDVV